MSRFFGIPFALAGDRVSFPDATQVDGSASYTQGFGFDYQREESEPLYKPVPRDGMNGIFFEVTEALGEIQRYGAALWQSAAAPYGVNSTAYHNGQTWRSLIANNNAEPAEGASWTALSSTPYANNITAGIVRFSTTAEAATGALDNVALTPAVTKPLLDAKAPIASPGFTGNPTAPTQNDADNSTRLANTAWVRTRMANALASYQTALGFTPVQQGGGIGQVNNKVYLGYDGGSLRATVDATDFGQVWADNNGLGKVDAFGTAAGFLKASNFAGIIGGGGWQFTIPTSAGNIIVKLFYTGSLAPQSTNAISFPNGQFPTECLGVVPSPATNQGTGGSDSNRYTVGAYNRTASGFTLVNDGATSAFFVVAFGR